MSDIAQKTLPPGSWPGVKGGKPAPATEDAANSEAAAPRSVVSHTQDQASNAGGQGQGQGQVQQYPVSHATGETGGHDDDAYSDGHYTTGTATGRKDDHDDALSGIPEEAGSSPHRVASDGGVESLDDLEPEPMADDQHASGGGGGHMNGGHANGGHGPDVRHDDASEAQPSGHEAADSADVQDRAVPAGTTETPAGDQAKEVASGEHPEEQHEQHPEEAEPESASHVPAEAAEQQQQQQQQEGTPATTEAGEDSAKQQSLTDRAKRLFDRASENQPTTEQRDNFLQTARSTLSGLSGKSRKTQQEQQHEEGVPGEAGEEGAAAAEGAPPEGEDLAPAETGAEGQRVTEGQEGEGEEGQHDESETPAAAAEWQTAPSQAPTGDEQAPSQAGEGEQQITLSQLGSDVPTEVREELFGQQGQRQAPQITPSQLGSDVPTETRERILQLQQEGKQITPSQLGSDVPTEVRERILQQQDDQQQQQQQQQQQVPQITPSQLGSDVPEETRERLLQMQRDGQQITPSQLGSDMPPETRERLLKLLQQQQEAQQAQQAPGSQAADDEAHEEVNTFRPAATIPSTEMQDQLAADFAILKGGRVNKGGNVVNDDGKVIGRVTQGKLQYLIGRTVDEEGNIWSPSGKVIGRAEPLSEDERNDMFKEPAPFESFPGAVVNGDGYVVADNGEIVGKVVAGDLHVLRGKEVDADGDILDRGGNVIGKAERWEPEPEEEPEPEVIDRSILAGKRVNKAGNVVDGSGTIYGRVVEGDVRSMVGRMCDKNGNVLSESGDVIGRAELVTEGEREGLKEGPFAELEGCTVAKDGTVVTPSGDVVGRLVTGDPKVLFGRAVDEDGDVLDRNGNVIGKAERWEPEEVEKKLNPMCGRRVNRQGDVVDEDGNIIGKLTSGNLQVCSGKEIDGDGDVVDSKGTVIGHCSLLEDIPAEEPEEETPEEKAKREQAETDRKLAIQMAVCISQCLDKIRPICKMITEKIDKAERTPEDERDEEQLVREVRPLIEEGGRILTEAQGIIKGLDPDGRISANAKHKTAAREATPEEYHLADVLKDLTGDVTECIESSKRKLEDMPHAKKELNPLWGLLNEPLFQILAAVGLLLNGVLSLVGRLLSGLGLGGLVDGLLGTLGINRVLEGLGLGQVSKSLSGGKKRSGGLLGGLLGGS